MITLRLMVHGSLWREETYREPDFDPELSFRARCEMSKNYLTVILADFKYKYEKAIAAIKSEWVITATYESKINGLEIFYDD